jgi:cardiolipin synthase
LHLKLLVQPEDGVAPLLAAVKSAKKSIEIVVFRFDRAELEAALKAAVGRGVLVSALIAYANRGGEKHLRKLELRLLEAGVTVSRTADDLVRYHDKLLIIDRRILYVLSFNFTHLDIDHSRGFGVVTKKTKLVQEALSLFDADSARKPYTPGLNTFIVSPVNARKQLAAFLHKARKELLIYDPKIADSEMLRILNERAKAGVTIKIIGSLSRKSSHLHVRRLTRLRLHTRTIIRDRHDAFVGSQSLRHAELDSRREVGVIVGDSKIVDGLIKTFESDWGKKAIRGKIPVTPQTLKKALKGRVKKLSPLKAIAREAAQEVMSKAGKPNMAPGKMKETVDKAVKEAVRERVDEILSESKED